MTVGDDNGCRVMFQTRFHHFAGMDLSMVDGAGEERFVSNEAMLVIEEERHKFFALQRGELQAQPVPGGLRLVNAAPGSRNWFSSRVKASRMVCRADRGRVAANKGSCCSIAFGLSR